MAYQDAPPAWRIWRRQGIEWALNHDLVQLSDAVRGDRINPVTKKGSQDFYRRGGGFLQECYSYRMRPSFHRNAGDKTALNFGAGRRRHAGRQDFIFVAAEISQLDSFAIECDFKRVGMF